MGSLSSPFNFFLKFFLFNKESCKFPLLLFYLAWLSINLFNSFPSLEESRSKYVTQNSNWIYKQVFLFICQSAVADSKAKPKHKNFLVEWVLKGLRSKMKIRSISPSPISIFQRLQFMWKELPGVMQYTAGTIVFGHPVHNAVSFLFHSHLDDWPGSWHWLQFSRSSPGDLPMPGHTLQGKGLWQKGCRAEGWQKINSISQSQLLPSFSSPSACQSTSLASALSGHLWYLALQSNTSDRISEPTW